MKNVWKNAMVWCVAIFLTLAAVIAFYFFLLNGSSVKATIDSIMSALAPVWLGIAVAYIVDPLIAAGERRLKKRKVPQTAARVLMLGIVLILVILLIFLIVSRLVPKLVETINGLLSDLPGMQRTFNKYLNRVNEWNPDVYDYILDTINAVTEWINTNLYTTLNTITQSFVSLITGIANIFVALIVFAYAQMSKERFVGQSKKLLYAVCHNKKAAAWILDVFRQANLIFSGFITGKIVDSIIVGIICFICLSILKMPYVLLISIVIGITNVVPVFGPFIGAIPCAILLLFVEPWDCLVFVIYILILQQVDGNIIGPKILGTSTGVSAFWVIFAILVFSKLLGIIGMIVGVPIFATLYYIIKRLTEEELERQGLPTDSMEYVNLEQIDEENQLIYHKEAAYIRKQAQKLTLRGMFSDAKSAVVVIKNKLEKLQESDKKKGDSK